MQPSRREPSPLAAAAAAIAFIFAPELALAQQSSPPPPAQIGNRVDHKERQPNPTEICASGAKESVDCSPQTSKELDEVRQEIEAPQQAHPDAGNTKSPPSGTR